MKSDFSEGNPEKPEYEFEPEHVYGYRASDTQQNLRYNEKGEAVFMVAALGVVMDTKTGEQRFYGGKEVAMESKNEGDDTVFHRNDIISLDISKDRKTVVTGQVGKNPAVHVWDAETQEQKAQFCLSHEKGVSARGVAGVSVSPCQRYVAAVDQSNDHHVFVYNIERNKLLLNTEGGKEKIFDVKWSKRVDDLRFATIGTKEIKFWHAADITKRLSQKGTFGKNATMTNLTCLDFDEEGWAYTGGENGQIHVWSDSC